MSFPYQDRSTSLSELERDKFEHTIPGPEATTMEIREWIDKYFKDRTIDDPDGRIDKFIRNIWWEEDDVWVVGEHTMRNELRDFGIPNQFRNCLARRIVKTREVSYESFILDERFSTKPFVPIK